eukprot:TRINITY_DN20966_c0_g1_i1.p1 TRINITY_DN20966_c0_g1~~TRINITY_DN20966_c0_g1_i1.p1  ORF type:complete len:487 (-),score=66.12 TRINITY_DN20966_c0_g1_i1:60-1520(-)
MDAYFAAQERQWSCGSSGCAESRHLLNNMQTTDHAFVVFYYEASRDRAIKALERKGGAIYKGHRISLTRDVVEPEDVHWEMYGISKRRFRRRWLCACVAIVFALVLWYFGFFRQYADIITSFDFEVVEGPSGPAYFGFVFIIVVANLAIYAVCAYAMGKVGFRSSSNRETGYVITYYFSVVVQVTLDMNVLAVMVANMLKAAQSNTLSNTRNALATHTVLDTFGYQFLLYCMPSTFFAPFVGEGVGAIYLPWVIMKLVVRSRPELIGRKAEKAMQMFLPMDLGRYSDIAINLALMSIMFGFPHRYIFPVLVAYIMSHVYIYAYDHYRILRNTQGFIFSKYSAERATQYLMTIPCGIMLAILVYKLQCPAYICHYDDSIKFIDVFVICGVAFFVHIIVHCAFIYFIPRMVKVKKYHVDTHYAAIARKEPCNWFSSNPVNCLRSLDFYNHRPPCDYFIRGREHFMEENTALGQYFVMPHKVQHNMDTE